MCERYLRSKSKRARSIIFRSFLVGALYAAAIGLSCRAAPEGGEAARLAEPDAALAAGWWPAQRNVWTPVGWKDHLFRFNVLYNGTVIAQPHPTGRETTAEWAGQGVQLTVYPSSDGKIPERQRLEPYQLSSNLDRGVGDQGWRANPAPVLRTDWKLNEGIVLRKEIFAHIPGAGDVKSGVEPLYAWIRLSVHHVDELQAPENFRFVVHLGAVHVRKSMRQEDNLRVVPGRSAYPRKLAEERFSDSAGRGYRILEQDGRVRLVAFGLESGRFRFAEREPAPADEREKSGAKDCYLVVTLPVRTGAFADLLLPMIPGARQDVDAEMALGFDGALNESDRYWSVVPETASRIETPEEQLNQAIRKSLKFAEVITEKNPSTGEYSFLSGSWQYDLLWPTPTSMTSHMLLDILGYHSVVEKHIEIFRENQGTVKPPGEAYRLHPGYFSSPKTLTSIDWLADHGAVLYEVSKHALLTGDRQFVERWLEAVIAGCEFIKESRAIKGHDGVAGVLPPAVATDRKVATQSVWNIGWNYKGLSTAVRLLRRTGNPRAEEFAAEARDYKETFVRVLRERTAEMPTWRDSEGRTHRIVPHSLTEGGEIFHAFYLDTGPLFLVWSGLLEADDPLMRSTAAFFREGPHTRVFDPMGNCWQRPVLIHEISSCEPCYSWNIYHSWQLADRYRFLEGMYSLLAGALSPQTYISCETRHGIYGNIFAAPLLVDLVRLSVLDDLISEGELHLLRLVPGAWLSSDSETRFEKIPTEFGPVSIAFKLAEKGKALLLSYRPEFRHEPEKVLLHVPPLAGLERVIINGLPAEAEAGEILSIE